MNLRKSLDELVQNQYKELSSKLGDAHFQIKKLKTHISKLEEEIESLNSSYPLAAAAIAKSELEEKDNDEQSGD